MELNPEFERWAAKETFSAHDVPLSDGTKLLMQRAYEAGRQWQVDKDAVVIEGLTDLVGAAGCSNTPCVDKQSGAERKQGDAE